MRQKFVSKLKTYSSYYTKVLGGKEELEKHIEKLKGPENNKMTQKYWLSNLDVGQLLLSTYSRPVCFWSSIQSNCYVPHHVSPDQDSPPIHLCFVDDCHWVLLEPNCSCTLPIPPISRITKGFTKKMILWQKHFKDGLSIFNNVN